MRYTGTSPIPEPKTKSALLPVKNRPGLYIRVREEEADQFRPLEIFRQLGGQFIVQDVLKRRRPLDGVVTTWALVTFQNNIESKDEIG